MTKKRVAIMAACAALAAVMIGVAFFGVNAAVNNPQRLLSLGERYLLEMDYEQAVVYFERVIKIEPKNARAYIATAEAYDALGQTDKAIETLRLGLERTEDPAIAGYLAALEMRDAPVVAQVEEITPTPTATIEPTKAPIIAPVETIIPTIEPTQEPSATPTVTPTPEPTYEPTEAPTFEPTIAPTETPTVSLPTETVAPTATAEPIVAVNRVDEIAETYFAYKRALPRSQPTLNTVSLCFEKGTASIDRVYLNGSRTEKVEQNTYISDGATYMPVSLIATLLGITNIDIQGDDVVIDAFDKLGKKYRLTSNSNVYQFHEISGAYTEDVIISVGNDVTNDTVNHVITNDAGVPCISIRGVSIVFGLDVVWYVLEVDEYSNTVIVDYANSTDRHGTTVISESTMSVAEAYERANLIRLAINEGR